MKYDFTCSCGKGIRIVRGDLAQVTCGACGKAAEVPKEVRAGLPTDFRSLAAPAAPRKGWLERRFSDQLFFSICWGVGVALALVPIVLPPEELKDYRAAKADPTPERVQEFLNKHGETNRQEELSRLAFAKALASGDLAVVRDFAKRLGGRPRGYDMDSFAYDAKVWELACKADRADGYETYKLLFPSGEHEWEAGQKIAALTTAPSPQQPQQSPPGEEADRTPPATEEDSHEPAMEHDASPWPSLEESAKKRAEEERQALEQLRQNKALEDAFAFLERHPDSPARGEARQVIFDALNKAETNRGDTPVNESTPLSKVLRQALSGNDGDTLTVSVSGFTSDDARARVLEHVRQRMRSLGVTMTQVESGGALSITGTESTDDTRSFNKFGLAEAGPYAESITVTVELTTPSGDGWSAELSASTPHSVSYTVFNNVDTGPTQGDVHRETLGALSTSLMELFKYR